MEFSSKDSWNKFLKRLRDNNFAKETVINDIESLASYITKLYDLPFPSVAPNEFDDGFEVYWESRGRFLSFEIFNDGKIDWFLRNRDTDKYYEKSYSSIYDLYTDNKLKMFYKL